MINQWPYISTPLIQRLLNESGSVHDTSQMNTEMRYSTVEKLTLEPAAPVYADLINKHTVFLLKMTAIAAILHVVFG